eukprot:1191504-Prorocentrum_minimum.AAC.4
MHGVGSSPFSEKQELRGSRAPQMNDNAPRVDCHFEGEGTLSRIPEMTPTVSLPSQVIASSFCSAYLFWRRHLCERGQRLMDHVNPGIQGFAVPQSSQVGLKCAHPVMMSRYAQRSLHLRGPSAGEQSSSDEMQGQLRRSCRYARQAPGGAWLLSKSWPRPHCASVTCVLQWRRLSMVGAYPYSSKTPPRHISASTPPSAIHCYIRLTRPLRGRCFVRGVIFFETKGQLLAVAKLVALAEVQVRNASSAHGLSWSPKCQAQRQRSVVPLHAACSVLGPAVALLSCTTSHTRPVWKASLVHVQVSNTELIEIVVSGESGPRPAEPINPVRVADWCNRGGADRDGYRRRRADLVPPRCLTPLVHPGS